MMKRNKLYTVNPWNKEAFRPRVNLFDGISNATQQMNNAGSSNTGYQYLGNTGNPYSTDSYAHYAYNRAAVHNGNYFNNNGAFTVQPQNYVNGYDYKTNYNDAGQRFNAIINTAQNGLGNWKNAGMSGSGDSGGGTPEAGNMDKLGTAMGIANSAAGAFTGIQTAYSGNRPQYSADAQNGFAQLDTLLTGGKKSKFGTGLVNAGAAVMNRGGMLFHGLGALAAGVLGTAGTIINNLAGYEIENEGAVRENTGRLKNIHFTARDNDSLVDQFNQAGIRKVGLGEVSNGLLTDEGTREAARISADQDLAYDFAMGNFENAKYNIDKGFYEDYMRDYFAYGGPLNTFAMGGNKKKYRTTTKDKSGTTTEVYVPGGYVAETITNEGDTIYKKPSDSWWNPFERVSARRASNGPAIPDYRRLQQEYRDAYKGSTESSNVGVDRVKDFINNLLGTSYDYGGPLDFSDDVSAIKYGFVSDYLTEKKRQNDLKNKMPGITQMPSFVPSYALGGDLQTNGGDWSTGLTHIEAGGTHEENPYEGVQIGVDREGIPNLVEEGEVVFNDYVYSQRIALDKNAKDKLHFPKKQDITYADAAKRLEREIKERPNDPISQAGFEAQMGDLAEEQERQKAEMEAAKAQEAFDSLSDEEKVAVMRQAAQQEQMAQQQAMQEQAMAEQAAAQQQLSPEEMAMMEQQAAQEQMMVQQAAPQGIPEEAMMGAYGGLINRFDLGGLAWIKKNHPEVKNPQVVAKALEKMMQENKSNYYRPDSTSMFGNNRNKKYSWDFKSAWNEMSPAVKSLSAYERSFNKWVKYGLSREDAFKVSHPESYYKGYEGDLGTERKGNYNAAYKRLVKDYKQPAAAPKPQVRTSVQQQVRTKIPTYINSKGEKFYISEDGKYYHSEKAALIANDKYRKSIPTYTNSKGEVFYVGDNGSYYRNIDAAVSSNTKYRGAKAAQQQAPAEESPTRSAYRPPVAEVKAKPAAKQAAQRQVTERQVAPAQSTPRQATNGINVGTYRGEGNQWNSYGLPGLQYYLDNAILDYQGTEDPVKQREKLQKIADTLNGVQESYYKNVAPTLGQSVQQRNKDVGEHQRLYQTVTNNQGFRGLDDAGNLIDLTDQAVVMPEGHNTTDNLANGWVDEYSGPKTWLRYLGASGDDLNDEVARLREIGIDFSPYQDWTIGSGDNARQLYRASLLDAAAEADTPVPEQSIPEDASQFGDANPAIEIDENPGKDTFVEVDENGNPIKKETEDWTLKPVHKQDWMRYAGLFGPAVGLGMQALGIGKPDASGITAAANAASGPAHLATPHLIGDYMRYTPFDRLFYSNQLQANARATDRALMNNSGANRGTAMAGLLANAYNTNNNLGNLFRQGDEYNRAQYERTKDFNRGTNQFNAQALNQNSQFNAEAMNRQRQYAAQMQMQAAAQKAGMDADWYNGIYGNVAGLFKGLGDLGRENAQHNTVADMVATGIFGTIKNQPIANGFVKVVPKSYQSAKGGKIKRKKNKRGLTF